MAKAWKEIRVFISSTFKDMQAERDHLVRFVFPRLREELAKRQIRMVDVDLRWGVTADQDAFELCMREIENCHPRFLCMLGGRYGWVPPPTAVAAGFMERLRRGESAAGALDADELALLDRVYPRRDAAGNYKLVPKPETVEEVNRYNEETARVVAILQRARHIETERSITASEVFFGALDRPYKPTFRYFYFRDDAVTRSIPDSHAGIYREPEESFGEKELAKLEQRIRDAHGVVKLAPDEEAELPVPVYVYPCRWDDATQRVTGLREFGERVYADLLASVEAQFGHVETGELPWYEEEQAAIEAFVEPRVERYVVGSRAEVFDRLHAHLAGSGGTGVAVLVGEPGSGKSALLARLWRELERGTPDHPARTDTLVLPHFVGASAASTNLRQLLRRLCHELQAGTGIEGEIPDDFEKLREAFPDFLERAAKAKPVLLLVDAINQLDPDNQAHAMRWLPETLPAGARAIVTVLEKMSEAGKPPEKTTVLEALRARRTPPEEVPLRALTAEDAQEIVNQYLARYRKSLDAAQRALLLDKRDAGKPLYLLTALEELRTLGVYEEIKTRIERMPEETQPLFLWTLKRLEGDDGFRDEAGELVGPVLVRRWCSYLAAGRAGMSQRELAELVAPARERQPEDTSDPEPDALGNVAALQRLLRPYLMSRGELLDFFHGQLKEAVLAEYLGDEQERLDTHRAIADYFEGLPTWLDDEAAVADVERRPNVRKVGELAYHLTRATEWHRLKEALSDLDFIEARSSAARGGVYELQADYEAAVAAMPASDDKRVVEGFRRAAQEVHGAVAEYPELAFNHFLWAAGRRCRGIHDLAPAIASRRAPWLEVVRDHADQDRFTEEEQPVVRHEVTLHSGSITTLVTTADGRVAVSGSDRGAIHVWDTIGGQPLEAIRADEFAGRVHRVVPLPQVAISLDARCVLVQLESRRFFLWDRGQPAASGELSEIAPLGIFNPAISGDGQLIVLGPVEGNEDYSVWDRLSRRYVDAPPMALPKPDHPVTFATDQRLSRIAMHFGDAECWVWDRSPRSANVYAVAGHERITCAALSADGRLLVTGDRSGAVRLFTNVGRQWRPRVLGSHDALVSGVCVSRDEQWVASCGHDGKLRIWQTQSGALELEFAFLLADDTRLLTAVAQGAGARSVILGGNDGICRVIPLESLDQRASGSQPSVVDIAKIASDGRTVMCVDLGRRGRLEASGDDTGPSVVEFQTDQFSQIALAANGTRGAWMTRVFDDVTIAARAPDGWSIESLGLQRSGITAVGALGFSQDGSLLAVGDEAGIVWFLRLDRERDALAAPDAARLDPGYHGIRALAVTRSHRWVALGFLNGATAIWDRRRRTLIPGPAFECDVSAVAACDTNSGFMVAAASGAGQIMCWSGPANSEVTRCRSLTTVRVGEVVLGRSGELPWVVSPDGWVQVFESQSGKLLTAFRVPGGRVLCCAFDEERGELHVGQAAAGGVGRWVLKLHDRGVPTQMRSA